MNTSVTTIQIHELVLIQRGFYSAKNIRNGNLLPSLKESLQIYMTSQNGRISKEK